MHTNTELTRLCFALLVVSEHERAKLQGRITDRADWQEIMARIEADEREIKEAEYDRHNRPGETW